MKDITNPVEIEYEESCYWFIFQKNKLILFKNKDRLTIPMFENSPLDILMENINVFDTINEVSCVVASAFDFVYNPKEYVLTDLWTAESYLSKDLFRLACKGFEILHWDRNSLYCPHCGIPTQKKATNSKYCEVCDIEIYPTITPAVLILVQRGKEILLAQGIDFKDSFHSILAGFLETGETLEECAIREVKEEVGIEITNVRYFGNQVWPYPSGIMIGFFADYKCGQISIQEEEIVSAGFYNKKNLPTLPPPNSLSRRMIDEWIDAN